MIIKYDTDSTFARSFRIDLDGFAFALAFHYCLEFGVVCEWRIGYLAISLHVGSGSLMNGKRSPSWEGDRRDN